MAKIDTNKQGGIVTWDWSDFVGLTSDWGLDTTASTSQSGLTTATGMDPFRKPGYISPGVNPLSVTNASEIDGILKNGLVYGNDAYMIGGTKLHQLTTLLSGSITNSGSWPHTISGATVGWDVCLYRITNSGTATPYLFYSWHDGTNSDVGRFDLSSTFDDDWMTSVPTGYSSTGLDGSIKPVMIVNRLNRLLIGNGRYVAELDGNEQGASGAIQYKRLTLPANFQITSFARTPTHTVIFAYDTSPATTSYRGLVKAFFWDDISEDFSYDVVIPGSYVDGGFTYKNGLVGCFTEGQSDSFTTSKGSRILLGNEGGFETIDSFTDNIPGHGGVEVFGDVIFWNSSGHVYQKNSPIKDFPDRLNRITKGGGSTAYGMFRNFAGTRPYISTGTGATNGIQRLNAGYYPGTFTTSTVNLPCPVGYRASIDAVNIHWYSEKETGSNKMEFKIITNRGASSTTVIATSGTVGNDRQTPPAELLTRYEVDNDGVGFPATTTAALNVTYSDVDSTKLPAIISSVQLEYSFEKISTIS